MSTSSTLSQNERKTEFETLLAETETPEERRRLARLYTLMNREVLKLEKKVEILEDLNAAHVAQTRPPSSIEALAMREASRNLIVDSVVENTGSNATFALISDEHAVELVTGYMRGAATTDIGCLEPDLASGHRNGYVKVNLRKTRSRLEGSEHRLIDGQVYLHQLALVASGRRNELNATFLEQVGGGNFQISHLCHNGKCFNETHLIVERSEDNKDRNTCQSHAVVKYKDEFSYDACRHGALSMRKRCILPVKRYSEPGYYCHN